MGKSYPNSFDHFIQQFEEIIDSSRDFLTGVDENAFLLKPSQDSWCIGECYSHLVQTGNLYLEKVNEGMQAAATAKTAPQNPMSLRFHMRWFVQYLEPPISMKTKAPGAFQPLTDSSITKKEVQQAFLDQQQKFLEHLETAKIEHIDLSKIKVANPLISLVGMTLAECIAVTEAHTRRHMEQAENVLRQVRDKSNHN